MADVDLFGDNCIQNFHLGRYIVGNLVLWRRASGAVKRDFRPYIRRYTFPNEILNMAIPIQLIGGATTQAINKKVDRGFLICTLGINKVIAGKRLV